MPQRLNILIVDDDADNAQSLGELFEIDGHTVSVVHTGEDAISAYMQNNFDIAFMDVMMPGKNGVESFLEIKKMKPTAKVIMMTGFSVEQLLQQAIENGAIGVLTKPMEPKKILSMLDKVGPEGVVVAPALDHAAKTDICTVLSEAGRSCHLVRSSTDFGLPETGHGAQVVLIDMQKPLIDGVGCFSALRRTGLRSQTIIFADANGYVIEGDDAIRDFRVTGILSKPFDPHFLLNTLGELAA